ncbi:hypothetical protein [Bifidobacterium vespertilionis]|uniref:hypothetical protein n=1 Tax=Bifidobacterium vespertilionis TaxID=2562524 RepID=UPI001BDC3BA1|nr:hypothetical protein [Bifidobacterium vespertilionis]MBT1180287.1 hypothetical protein [Bifidobacterium vespertilionis]
MKKNSLHEISGLVLRRRLSNIPRQKVFVYIDTAFVVLLVLSFAFLLMGFLPVREKSFQDIFNDKIWDSIAVVAFISIPIIDRLSTIRQSIKDDNQEIGKLYIIFVFLAAILIISVQICICMLMWIFVYKYPIDGAVSVNAIGAILVLSIVVWEMVEFISCALSIFDAQIIPSKINIITMITIVIICMCVWYGPSRQSLSESSGQTDRENIQSLCIQYDKLIKLVDEIGSVVSSNELSEFPSYSQSLHLRHSFINDVSCEANEYRVLKVNADIDSYNLSIESVYSNLNDEYRNWLLKKMYLSNLGQG